MGITVDPVVALGPRRHGQQAFAFVEPDGLCADAGHFGEVSDAHVSITPLDLAPDCNVYGRCMEITVQYFDGCPNWETAAERVAMIAAAWRVA